MKSVICFLMVVAPLFGAESTTVGQAEMAYNKEFNEAKAVFDARVKAAQDKFVVVLKAEMKKLTQAGDLDGAMVIREKIKNLESVEQITESSQNTRQVTNISWDSINSPIVTIHADKEATVTLAAGKWKIIPNPNDKWSAGPGYPLVSSDGVQHKASEVAPLKGRNIMLLVCKFQSSTGETFEDYKPVFTGPGKLTLFANDLGLANNSGYIRIKIIMDK